MTTKPSMSLNLTKIHGTRDHVERTFSPTDFDQLEEIYRIVAPVWLEFDVHKDHDRFPLIGKVVTTLALACGRCLEDFTMPVDARFDLQYLPHAKNTGEGEQEIEQDDLSTAYYEDETIDLDQLMREQFYLALPMKPICAEDCRGLCPECGTNLNTGSCACSHRWEDPRLAPLKSLRKKTD